MTPHIRERLLGVVPEERIRTVAVSAVPAPVVERFLALTDMTCAIADALDGLGLGAVCASGLRPVRGDMRLCGPAVTLRYTPIEQETSHPVLGDRDLHGLAPRGGIAVIDAGGERDYAVLGELSAAWATLAGVAGVVVDGAVRDLDALAAGDLPVWSRSAAARKALGRLDVAELNGVVQLAGATVRPGDLVAADGNGVVIVPREAITQTLQRCGEAQIAEERLKTAIAVAADLPALVRRVRAGQHRP